MRPSLLALAAVVALTTAVYVQLLCEFACRCVGSGADLPQYHRLSHDVRVVRIDPDARHPDAAIDLTVCKGCGCERLY